MKRSPILPALVLVAAASLVSAADSREAIITAAKKLGDQASYSWNSTVVVPEGTQFRPGPSEGKTEKGGITHVVGTFNDTKYHTVLKGDKGAVTNQEGTWQSLAEIEKEEGFGRFRALAARGLKTPAVQAADLAKGVKEIKQEGDVYSGELNEETAKDLLAFGRRGADAPGVSNAKGSAKFWLKEGSLAKYEFHIKGTRGFNGNDMEIDRKTTIEIKDVGTTKISIPDEAKQKLN